VSQTLANRVPQALAVGLVLALATGCSANDLPRFGMPKPVTNHGPKVLALWQGTWIAGLAIGALVWGLIVWSVVYFRRSRHKIDVPVQTRYNLPIEIMYTIVPLVVIAVLFYFTAKDESSEMSLSKAPDQTINVVGRQWAWTFNYVDQNTSTVGSGGQIPTLYLPEGKNIRFVLTSADVIHGFWVPAFLFKEDVIPGRVNQFEVTPTKVGTFAGKCTQLCGVDHDRMLFWVKVVPQQEYLAHMDQMRAGGQSGLQPMGIVPGNSNTVSALRAETEQAAARFKVGVSSGVGSAK
jgi:cytochrome c oxidase subunit 2